MHTRYISHADGPPNDLNVDELWSTLVQQASQVCQQSVNAAMDPNALDIYHGPAGFAVFARLVSSFPELGPPLDQVGRANLSESLQEIRQNCLPNIAGLLNNNPKWKPKSSSRTSYLGTPVGIATEILLDILSISESAEESTMYNDKHNLPDTAALCTGILHRALKIQAREAADDSREDDGCEVLYGQAGLLYALLRLRGSIPRGDGRQSEIGASVAQLVDDASISKIVQSIITRARFGSSVYASNASKSSTIPSLMWSWHYKRYLGAGHGVAGILHILLLCPVDIIRPYISDILQTVEWLTTMQGDDGNWASSLKLQVGSPRSDDLVQWCHGAPGMLILFTTLVRRAHLYPDIFPLSASLVDNLAAAIQRGAAIVYERGLLRKGVGLCHGVAGSVYALLAACDVMGIWKRNEHSKVYFLSAIHLAHLATSYTQFTSSGEMTTPDKPWSLYGGVAGMCCALAETYDRLGTAGRNLDQLEFSWCRFRSGMPGFDDIDTSVKFVKYNQ